MLGKLLIGKMSEEFVGRILVYSIVGCPYCLRAKSKLAELGLPYTDVSVDDYAPEVRDDLKKRTGRATVPQIFFNEVLIGGNDDLQTLLKNKQKFDQLLQKVKTEKPPKDAPQPPDQKLTLDQGKSGEFVCESDEYVKLVEQLRNSGIIKDHRTGLISRSKSSFLGKDFVDWVIREKQLDHSRAIEMGKQLISRSFGHAVAGGGNEDEFNEDTYYRLLEDDESSALNAGQMSECAPHPAGELSELLRKQILKLYGKNLTANGKAVNYKGIAADPEFQNYLKLAKELHRVDVVNSSREEKLAFFINIYNALVIHATIKMGAPTNLWQRYKFFNTMSYIIGGHQYTLQDIENGVLRGNKRGVGMMRKPFGSGDPRLKIALPEAEPLIHFALNCGAKSCPPIKTFTTKGIKTELKVAAEAFLESDDAVRLDAGENEIFLSQIFKWYKEDFGNIPENVVQFVHDHLGAGKKLDTLTKMIEAGGFKLKYNPYDWGQNSTD